MRLWLIICIAALAQFSETVYTAALPTIAADLHVADSLVEATLTTFLLGFACGVLLWGRWSDRVGRRPALLTGVALYLVACLGCCLCGSIGALLTWRFVQALGASTGSVVGQAIAREGFPPGRRRRVFSTISMAMAFAPALGAAVGGTLSDAWGWRSIFIVLMGLGTLLVILIATCLPETRLQQWASPAPLKACLATLSRDAHVRRMAFLIGATNGIFFAYYAEAPFIFVDLLGLSAQTYGDWSLGLAAPLLLGASLSRHLEKRVAAPRMIIYGCITAWSGALVWVVCALNGGVGVALTAVCAAWVMTGLAMALPNCLSTALKDYSHMAGTAASLLGGTYYVLAASCTYAMALLHNGTALRLPLLVLAITTCMVAVAARNRS